MKLNKKLIATVIAASFGGTAQAADNYANLQLAISDVNGFDNGMALVAAYGMPMANINPNVSFEAELTMSIDDPSVSESGNISGNSYTGEASVSYTTVAGYAVYSHPLNEKLDLRARAGLLYESVKATVSMDVPALNYSYSGSGTDTDFGLSFGVGAKYTLSDKMNLVADYTVIESDIKHIAVGVQMGF